MAHHKQALKRQRQSETRHARNRQFKSRMKTAVKKALAAAEAAKPEDKARAFQQAESMIRHVAQKGVIPKKRASRKVSRLAKRLLVA